MDFIPLVPAPDTPTIASIVLFTGFSLTVLVAGAGSRAFATLFGMLTVIALAITWATTAPQANANYESRVAIIKALNEVYGVEFPGRLALDALEYPAEKPTEPANYGVATVLLDGDEVKVQLAWTGTKLELRDISTADPLPTVGAAPTPEPVETADEPEEPVATEEPAQPEPESEAPAEPQPTPTPIDYDNGVTVTPFGTPSPAPAAG